MASQRCSCGCAAQARPASTGAPGCACLCTGGSWCTCWQPQNSHVCYTGGCGRPCFVANHGRPAPPPPAPLLQLVQQVTELVISELLWLNYASPEKPIYLYINSTGGCPGRLPRRCLVLWRAAAVGSVMLPISPAPASAARMGLWLSCPTATFRIVHWPHASPLPPAGSQTLNGEAVGFETEAYAILATLGYIRPDIYTLVSAPRHEGRAALPACGAFLPLKTARLAGPAGLLLAPRR